MGCREVMQAAPCSLPGAAALSGYVCSMGSSNSFSFLLSVLVATSPLLLELRLYAPSFGLEGDAAHDAIFRCQPGDEMVFSWWPQCMISRMRPDRHCILSCSGPQTPSISEGKDTEDSVDWQNFAPYAQLGFLDGI
jgi:hypothetical protein